MINSKNVFLIWCFKAKKSSQKNHNIRYIRTMSMVFPNVIYPLNAKKMTITIFKCYEAHAEVDKWNLKKSN